MASPLSSLYLNDVTALAGSFWPADLLGSHVHLRGWVEPNPISDVVSYQLLLTTFLYLRRIGTAETVFPSLQITSSANITRREIEMLNEGLLADFTTIIQNSLNQIKTDLYEHDPRIGTLFGRLKPNRVYDPFPDSPAAPNQGRCSLCRQLGSDRLVWGGGNLRWVHEGCLLEKVYSVSVPVEHQIDRPYPIIAFR